MTAGLEHILVEVMVEKNCSLVAAMEHIFDYNGVDKECVYDVVEFLEDGLRDLDIVSHFMKIWTGEDNDMTLKIR